MHYSVIHKTLNQGKTNKQLINPTVSKDLDKERN